MMIRMLVAILTVQVVMQAAEDDRAAGAATGGRAERMSEAGAVGSKAIQIRCFNFPVSVTAEIEAMIVGDNHDHISLPSGLTVACRCNAQGDHRQHGKHQSHGTSPLRRG